MLRTLRNRTRRMGLLATSVATIVAAGWATPASAAPEPYAAAYLSARAIAIGVDESTRGKTARVDVWGCCTGDLPARASVKIDATAAADVLVVAVKGDHCSVSGRVTTCDVPLTALLDPESLPEVNLKVAKGAKVGDRASVKLTVSGEGLRTTSEDSEIEVVDSAADLVAKSFTAPSARPGEVRGYQPTFRNSGDAAARYVGIWISDGAFVRFTQHFSNCRYHDSEWGSYGYCEFALNLAPGETARVSADTPISVKVQPDAPGENFAFTYYRLDVFDSPLQGDLGTPGNGPALKVEKVSATPSIAAFGDADWSDNQGNFVIPTAANPSDVSAVGATVTGQVGATVPVTVGLRNNGPAWLDGGLDGEGLSPDAPGQPATTVTLPQGVTVVSVPDGNDGHSSGGTFCAPIADGKADWTKNGKAEGLAYRCTASRGLDAGDTQLATFTVTIDDAATATGTVVAAGGNDDPNQANNTAAITLNPPAGGTGGGSGGGTPGTGGGLPVTGANAGLIGGAGVALLALGLGLYLAVRRRTVVLVTGEDSTSGS
ncbi:hypothetical protein ACNTMW_21000 [Planosporangium sp. 12N6]|uniref:hypothetical protein n=1 Tax=Planosporangium spinosum TaxID=3402278 RepID=UPI003CF3AE26